MAKHINNSQMALNLKDIFKMDLKMVKVHSNGIMDKFIKDNGIMVKNMEVESGKDNIIKSILDNGNIIMYKDLVYSSHPIKIDIKDNLKILLNMDMAHKDIIINKHILDNLNKIDPMEKDNIIGQMVAIIKDNLLIILDMDKEYISLKIINKFIKDNLEMIKNVD